MPSGARKESAPIGVGSTATTRHSRERRSPPQRLVRESRFGKRSESQVRPASVGSGVTGRRSSETLQPVTLQAAFAAASRVNTGNEACAATNCKVIALRQVKPWHASGARQHCRHRLVLPNPSVNRTRYGRQRKPGAQWLRHCRAPALRRLPPRAGYLER
jgi:hypothetical protein